MAFVKDAKGIYAWESLYTDGKWSTQQMYDFGFSRRFILVRRNNLFQPIKKHVRTLSIFKSMAFMKDAKGISFKNRFKGHINWRKVRNVFPIK
jgi:5'(3')-deoxyribonucleotidase